MAALTLEQLRERSRAKFPITVVRDEDYTVLTPTQIADAWTAYSGGTVGVRLKDTDDIWYAMDADLPKANGRGLLVFGGGKQYAQRCDFADCTVGQRTPSSWYLWNNDLNQSVLQETIYAKGVYNGLPYVEIAETGTPDDAFVRYGRPPGYMRIPDAEAVSGDVVIYRHTFDVRQLPDSNINYCVTSINNNNPALTRGDSLYPVLGSHDVNFSKVDDGGASDWSSVQVALGRTANVELSQAQIVRFYPDLTTVNTAFPDHFHCLNTSTTSAATIVPEIMQRPWEYEGAFSVEMEFVLPPRNLGNSHRLLEIGADADNRLSLLWNTDNTINVTMVLGGVTVADEDGDEVAPNETVKCVLYQTSQVTTFYVAGAEVAAVATGRVPDGVESLGHAFNGTLHAFANIVSYKQRKGLATMAQLEQWSAAA